MPEQHSLFVRHPSLTERQAVLQMPWGQPKPPQHSTLSAQAVPAVLQAAEAQRPAVHWRPEQHSDEDEHESPVATQSVRVWQTPPEQAPPQHSLA